MTMSLEEFHLDFFNDVRVHADADGQFMETAFLERFCLYLEEAGELDTFHPAHYRAAKGMRVDGYGGDPIDCERQLTLVIADFNADPGVASLTKSEIETIFKRLENFLSASMTDDFRAQLDEASPGYGLAELIKARRASIDRARLVLVSNRSLSARVEGRPSAVIAGVPTTFDVWDLSRLHRLVMSNKGREDIEIDFIKSFGGGLPCLPAHLSETDYQAFLLVMPGAMLASIYERWGGRLLEANVRSFLQASGKINKGIKRTIEEDPGMFFAYNNGITATAEEVVVQPVDGIPTITVIRNLQIVNGGQTTASVFNATRSEKGRKGLSRIFVQMKLSVVDPERSIEIVPKISEYANSQNKVNAADFFANHPFHVRLEEYSRRLWAPSSDGSFRETKWFYERARGQYRDARLNNPKKDKFDQEYPRSQLFSKTELAKYESVWDGIPEIVSKGAQFNFVNFAQRVGAAWSEDEVQFNELYFRTAVAKAIIFRETEALVSRQPWYDGYRAQIVAYTIAKLAHDVMALKRAVDFDAIWKRQTAGDPLVEALTNVADAVRAVITAPEAGSGNVTEWAKKPACWKRVKDIQIPLPASFLVSLLDPSVAKERKSEAKKTRRVDNSIEAQMLVHSLGPIVWESALQFAQTKKLLTPRQRSDLETASRMPRRMPTEAQCAKIVEALGQLESEGFAHPSLKKAA